MQIDVVSLGTSILKNAEHRSNNIKKIAMSVIKDMKILGLGNTKNQRSTVF